EITEDGSGISSGTCDLLLDGGYPYTGIIYYSEGAGKYCSGFITIDDPSGLGDGAQQLSVFVADNLGNGEWSADRQIQIDNTPPTIDSVVLSSYAVESGDTMTVTSNGADSGSGIATCHAWLSTDLVLGDDTDLGDLGTDCVGDVTIPLEDDGTYYIFVVPIDNVGNWNAWPSDPFLIDNTAPNVGPIWVEPYYDDGTVYISGFSYIDSEVDDGLGSGIDYCEYTLDGGLTWNLATYDDEEEICYTEVDTSEATALNIRAFDNMGFSTTGTEVPVLVDTGLPEVLSIEIDPSYDDGETTYISGLSTITLEVVDTAEDLGPEVTYAASGVQYCEIFVSDGHDGGEWYEAEYDPESGTCVFEDVDTSSAYGISTYVFDNVENMGEGPTLWEDLDYEIDDTGPTVEITSPTDTTYNRRRLALTYTATDAQSGVAECWYVLDLGDPIELPDCEGTTLTGLENGEHSVTVIGIDNLGNEGDPTVFFEVDAYTYVDFTENTPPDNAYEPERSLYIEVEYNDFEPTSAKATINGVSYTMTCDAEEQLCWYTKILASRGNKEYIYSVTLKNAEDEQLSTEERSVVLDTRDPAISYTRNNPRNGKTYTDTNEMFFEVRYNEYNVDEAWVDLNGDQYEMDCEVSDPRRPYRGYCSLEVILPNDVYTYSTTMTDLAGNIRTLADRTFTIDVEEEP
ncbi:hypothetical protein KJ780_00500, partial [Candidatus Micrarchaeota archaeon]|nr:hypothetical protein [Candidatus Micrarchaeota archaeon]